MSKSFNNGMVVLCIALVIAGFWLPFWPLSLLGVLLAVLGGRWISAVVLGLLLDIAYGAPVGRWHFLYIPFTLIAILGLAVQQYALGYMRKSSQNTL